MNHKMGLNLAVEELNDEPFDLTPFYVTIGIRYDLGRIAIMKCDGCYQTDKNVVELVFSKK